MLISHYDLYIGIGFGFITAIILILITKIIICQCCLPTTNHLNLGWSSDDYPAISNINAKVNSKLPSRLNCEPLPHRYPHPPVITQETSSHSARTSVASGGRFSVLSEKLSRLSIGSNYSARPSVASDSVLLHKKCESTRLSHSYEDADTENAATYCKIRSYSKMLSPIALSPIIVGSKSSRSRLYSRVSDSVERSIFGMKHSSEMTEHAGLESSRRSVTRINSHQNINACRRQSLLRSPSARYAVPKFPSSGKQGNHTTRGSKQPIDQTFLSLPISPQVSFHATKIAKVYDVFDVIRPDLYVTATKEMANIGSYGNSETINNNNDTNNKRSHELEEAQKKLQKLHVQIICDMKGNQCFINIIEAQYLPIDYKESANPYVKIYLSPSLDNQSRQTSVQRQTLNPTWNEYFKFHFTNEKIYQTTKLLKFYIFNYAVSSRSDCIGEAQLELTSSILHSGGDFWLTIDKQRFADEQLGELLVAITYVPQVERLDVGIMEARNLKALSIHSDTDPVVYVTLHVGQSEKIKRKKTSVKHSTLNPKWNEEISFNLAHPLLSESSLEIGVYHHSLTKPNEPLGFLYFEMIKPFDDNRTIQCSEIIHWREVVNGEQRGACWHSLRKAAKLPSVISLLQPNNSRNMINTTTNGNNSINNDIDADNDCITSQQQ